MPSRNEFKTISNTRFKEVKALRDSRLYDGAKYLSGYVIETALKARICKVLDSDYPETGEFSKLFFTHKFDILVRLGGLQKLLDNELNANVTFKTNWSLATNWNETFRYKPIGSSEEADVNCKIQSKEPPIFGAN